MVEKRWSLEKDVMNTTQSKKSWGVCQSTSSTKLFVCECVFIFKAPLKFEEKNET